MKKDDQGGWAAASAERGRVQTPPPTQRQEKDKPDHPKGLVPSQNREVAVEAEEKRKWKGGSLEPSCIGHRLALILGTSNELRQTWSLCPC